MEEATRYIVTVHYAPGGKLKVHTRVHQTMIRAIEEISNLMWDISDGMVNRFEFKVVNAQPKVTVAQYEDY